MLPLLVIDAPWAVAEERQRTPTENLYAVDMLDDGRHVWAVGAFGSVFRSLDGGRVWEAQPTPVLEPLFDVSFVDRHHGIAVGKSGVVLRTTDGGARWRRVQSGTEKHLFNVEMINARQGVAVGDWGVIIETADGGVSWSDRSYGEDIVLSGVSFADPEHGWIVGEFGTILATTNGGRDWQRQDPGTSKTLFGVAFTSAITGWVVGIDGLVLRTDDSGVTWKVQRGSAGAGSLEDLGFLDVLRNPALYDVAVAGNVGCIVGDTGTALITTDGGATWWPQLLREDVRLLWLRGASMTPRGAGILVGAKGLVVSVVDGRLGLSGTRSQHAARLGR